MTTTKKKVRKVKATSEKRPHQTPRQKFRSLLRELDSQLINRTREITGMLVALIARVHVLLLGPPGTAKSRQVDLIRHAVGGSEFFRLLMTRFSLPEEVNGPLDVPGLQEGRHERLIDGYLPAAHFGFLDEIFKANSSILNSLLQLINEREFRQGAQVVNCPLEMLVGASNELPESKDLDALYDRFLIRYWVDYLQDRGDVLELLKLNPKWKPATKLSLDDIHTAQMEADAVDVSDDVLELLLDIKDAVTKEGFVASDRRWKAVLPVLKANAYINGRDEVTEDDMQVLTDILWNEPKDRPQLLRVVTKAANPVLHTAQGILDAARETFATLPMNKTIDDADTAGVFEQIVNANSEFKSQITKLKKLTAGSDTTNGAVKSIIEDIEEMSSEASRFAARISGLNL